MAKKKDKANWKVCIPTKINASFSQTSLLAAIKQYQDQFGCWPVEIAVPAIDMQLACELTHPLWLSVVINTLPFAEWYVAGFEGVIYQAPV